MSPGKPPPGGPQPAPSAEYLAAFRMFGDMLTLAIIHFLSDGPRRFKELERLTCANPVTLTSRLKRLTEQGILTRAEHQTDRQAVSYSLDALGERAVPIVREIERFARDIDKRRLAPSGAGFPVSAHRRGGAGLRPVRGRWCPGLPVAWLRDHGRANWT